MKTLFVSLDKPDKFVNQSEVEGPKEKIIRFFDLRSPGGVYETKLKESFLFFKKDGSEESRDNLVFWASKMLLGSRFCFKYLPEIKKKSDKFSDDVMSRQIEYVPEKTLFHLTPVENLKSIKKKGIVSDTGKVYLTDDIDFLYDYALQRTVEFGRDVKYCLLKIDAKRLCESQKIYYKYINVFYTSDIAPEYIIEE